MRNTFKLLSKMMFLILLGNLNLMAQETPSEEPELKNSVLFNFGYTHIPDGAELGEGKSKGVYVPTVGLDIGREISEKWELLLMFDMELAHYLIVNKDLERENAFIVIAGASYKVFRHISVFGGLGVELEKNKNQFVSRLGTEYNISLSDRWELVPGIFFDFKEEFTSYSFGMAARYHF